MSKPDSGRPVRRLGFLEIVPGRDGGAPQGEAAQAQVPHFDLDSQIMANDRKLVAATRRGPGRARRTTPDVQGRRDGEASPSPREPVQPPPPASARVWRPAMPDPQRQVIAQIVARDIERLCRGERI